MLTHLTVSNYAIAEHIELQFNEGMTALTGETGAGKSIALDALGLVLGARADAGAVRHGAERADITAVFDVNHIPEAFTWLQEHDLEQDSDCVLRRVIRKDGRSRGYINGQPCTLQDLKQLGSMLLDIHSQHQHQSLMRRDTHMRLVDEFGQCQSLAGEVKAAFRQWQNTEKKLRDLRNDQDERQARTELLRYQVEELDRLAMTADELQQLEDEQKQLANAESILHQCHEAAQCCNEGEPSAATLLNQAQQQLERLPVAVPELKDTLAMLEEARIQVEEAGDNLRRYVDDYDRDPERLQHVEERLSDIYQLARKHGVLPDQLPDRHSALSGELAELDGGANSVEHLEEEAARLLETYQEKAGRLTETRCSAAAELDSRVSDELRRLSMPEVTFKTTLSANEKDRPAAHGNEEVEFLVSANAGQPPRPLNKVASGGELSRISLAIQVVVAQTSTIPTLIFDEVDVGIGGGVAEVVGRLLRTLGQSGQVLCVTHLPQVASQAHQHLIVSKFTEDSNTYSTVEKLQTDERVKEVARMLGGVDLTEQTMAHAQEMLDKGQATHH